MILIAKYVFPVCQKPLRDAGILVKDDKIAEVGNSSDLQIHYPDEEVIDFGKAAIMPGFVNLHTRIERTIIRGTVADEPYAKWLLSVLSRAVRLNSQDRKISAAVGCLEAIRSGTTTIADIANGDGSVNAINESGLRGVVYRETGAMDSSRINHAINMAEREIDEWQDAFASDRINVGIAAASVFENHPKMYKEISALASRCNLPVTMRLAGSKEEIAFIKRGTRMFKFVDPGIVEREYVETPPWLPFGVSSVEYAKNWGAFDSDQVSIIHGIHVDNNDISTIQNYNVGICSCPGSEAQLGMGAAPVSEYMLGNVPIGFGTDSPAATEATDMLSEMRFAMLMHRALNVQKYLRSSTVLELGTLGGAKVLGLDDKIGSLEIGKQADVTAVDLSRSNQILEMNPISAVINSCTAHDVVFTMVAGKILYKDKQFHNQINLDNLYSKFTGIRDKMIKPL